MQVKLKDIAAHTGFSITTVSRALGGYDDVNEATRQQILQQALDMGYQPNQVAQQLRTQRTSTLGMIIPANDEGFSDDFFSELMMGAGHAASQCGYDLLLSAQISAEDELQAYKRIVGGRRVDGVILARTRQDDPRITYLNSLNFPFVVSGRSMPDKTSDFSFIDVDSQLGIQHLVEHLVSLGHHKIALLLPPSEMAFTPYRLLGYQSALKREGITPNPDYVFYGDLKRDGGYRNTATLLAQSPEITAIVACNDLMALGAMRAIQEAGRVVGQDIAVTGFDDIPAAKFAQPPLTTIRQPIYEIGQRLIEMLVQIIQGDAAESQSIILEPELVIRESSGVLYS